MKTLLTLLLLSICSIAFGQTAPIKKDDAKPLFIPFDALNGAIVQEADNANKYARKADSAKWEIVKRILQIKQVDFSLISNSGDSLRITPEGTFLKLRRPKK